MKPILIAIYIFITSITLFSQKFNYEIIKFDSYEIPEHALPGDVKTYSIFTYFLAYRESKNTILDAINNITMPDYEKKIEIGDVHIELFLDTLELVGNLKIVEPLPGSSKEYNFVTFYGNIVYQIKLSYTKNEIWKIISSENYSVYDSCEFSVEIKNIYGLLGKYYIKKEYYANNLKKEVEKCIISKTINQIADKLQSVLLTYCHAKTEKTIYLYKISESAMDYSDIENAFNTAKEGYLLIKPTIGPDLNDEAKNKLLAAINIWESLLKEIDFKNKKARINEKIGRVLTINLFNAYETLNNYNEALRILEFNKSNKLRMADEPFFLSQAYDMKIDEIKNKIERYKTLYPD